MQFLKKPDGSALIGAVALSALLLITAAGFIRIVTNASVSETQSRDNDRALFAAESGLMLGARWLRSQNPFPAAGSTFTPFAAVPINSFWVDVKCSTFVNGTRLTARIISGVYSHQTQRTSSVFKKRITYNGVTQGTFGEFATFFDDIFDDHTNWGGFYRRSFDGRFHMNTYIEISSNSAPGSGNEVLFQNGLVTVHSNPNYSGNYGAGSHDNNNYNTGVQCNFSNPTAAKCDQIFTDEYIANYEQISIPTGLSSGSFQSQTHIDLPASTDEGTGYSHYRPTLEFQVSGGTGRAIYHYKSGGNLRDSTINNLDNKILICPQNLNVLGTVKGKVTVATASGKGICPVADIVYEDYDPVTKTIPQNSQNILGLVSGRHINFNHRWKKEWPGINTNITITGTLDITASVIAVETVSGVKSAEYWDLNNQCNYNVSLNGNHILKAWRYPTVTSGGNPSSGCMGYIDYLHDRRLIRDIQPPGYPSVTTVAGLLRLALCDWTEENSF